MGFHHAERDDYGSKPQAAGNPPVIRGGSQATLGGIV